MTRRLLYIGANIHLDPLVEFETTKDFVFIDTLPRSEFDKQGHFQPIFYSTDFVDRLHKKAAQIGFRLIYTKCIDPNYHKKILSFQQRLIFGCCYCQRYEHLNPTLMHFYNESTDQNLYYYISTNLNNNLNLTHCLRAAIGSCTGLIISGYHPKKQLIGLFRTCPIALFCYSHTCYVFLTEEEEEEEEDNIVTWMQENKSTLQKVFYPIYACNSETGNIVLCENYQEMVSITESMFKMGVFSLCP